MTESFKYGSNSSNYHKKLSSGTAAAATTTSTTKVSLVEKAAALPHSRLRKSFSECDSYEMESSVGGGGVGVSFNLSPSKRRQCAREEAIHRHHHCPRQQQQQQTNGNTIDGNNGDISFIDVAKVQYNYDTSKSQYLLQQQQKLKEYKNDPNYLTTNGDNYSSESSSTETRGILKKSTTASSTTTTTTSESNASNRNNSSKSNLLKRNKGLSTLSLCSCDADTEVSGKNKQLFFSLFLSQQPRDGNFSSFFD